MPEKCSVNHTEHSGYQTEKAISLILQMKTLRSERLRNLPEVTQ